MKENKVREPSQPAAKGIVPKWRTGPKLRRPVAKDDVVIPKKGVWAGEECVVLDVEKRLHAAGSYKVVHVLLPNGDDRWYPITQVTEVARDKAAILKEAAPTS
jgi:hypothetical protein